MNHLMRQDLLEIGKVNLAGWGTLGLTQSNILQMAELAHSLGSVILILSTLGYTLVKLHMALRESRWDKEDRDNLNTEK